LKFAEYEITQATDLEYLLQQNVFWRKQLGLLVLSGSLETHPQKSFWQNELNTHYYACGCDESASGFLIGVIVGTLWILLTWLHYSG
jgi:hypothetical protein